MVGSLQHLQNQQGSPEKASNPNPNRLRSSSREVRIRVPTFFFCFVYFTRGTENSPQGSGKGH